MIKGIKENVAQDMKTYKSYYTKIWNVDMFGQTQSMKSVQRYLRLTLKDINRRHIYFSLKLEKFIVQYKYLIPAKNVM